MDKNDLVVITFAIIISAFGITINLTRASGSPKTPINADKYTLFWFRILVPLSLIASLFFSLSRIGQINVPLEVWNTGLLMLALGIIIRWISIVTLGKLFTVDIAISSNHHLITTGLYKYLRHPSYTGLLMYYIGLGIVMKNWVSICLLIIFPAIAVAYRIGIEEQVLESHFKEKYLKYKKSSWRLFPFIY